jgi:hypothetical protein
MPAGHGNENQTAVQQGTAALRTVGLAVRLLKHDPLAAHRKQHVVGILHIIATAFAVALSRPFAAVGVVAEQTDVELQHLGVSEHGCLVY